MDKTAENPPETRPARRPSRLLRLARYILFRFIAGVVLALLLVAGARPALAYLQRALVWERAERATLSILRSESLAFLVTDRITTQIAIEIDDGSRLLGKREGILVCTVTLYYGMDLKKLDKACIARTNGTIVVTLPAPEELDFSVDPSSFKYLTKRSGFNVIADGLFGKDLEAELRRSVRQNALKFMADKKLIPARETMLRQISSLAAPFSAEIGVPLEFR